MRPLAAGLAAVLALTACNVPPGRQTITVLASWADDDPRDTEAQAFRKVLDGFELANPGYATEYRGTRNIGQALQAAIEAGRPPHIAMLPRLNDVGRYARQGKLTALDDLTELAGPAYKDQLLRIDAGEGSKIYGVSVLTHLKSMVWHRRDSRTDVGWPPGTWQQLTETAKNRGWQWCMGMASSPLSGWPGTDMIEDILLHQAGQETYERWAAGDEPWNGQAVTNAWSAWMEILPADRKAVLLTSFSDAGTRMLSGTAPTCHLDHQASFIISSYRPLQTQTPFDFFEFPTFGPAPAAAGGVLREISDDIAGMFDDTEGARKLIAYLASAPAQAIWRQANNGATFTLNRDVRARDYGDAVSQKVAATLATGTLCRDASDQMPSDMTIAFQNAILESINDPARLPRLLDELEIVRNRLPKSEWMTGLRCLKRDA